MLFGRKRIREVGTLVEQGEHGQDFWAIVRKQFRRNRMAVWSARILALLLFVAITADFIANEKPIYCKIEGKSYFPIFKNYLHDLGISKWKGEFVNKRWSKTTYDFVIYPPIPYSAKSLDRGRSFSPPGRSKGDEKKVHWLGTDQMGRDIAAIMVHGTRTAMLVGVVAMSIAALIGILLGGIAGYFGDYRLSLSRARIILNLLAFLLACYYTMIMPGSLLDQGRGGMAILLFVAILLVANLLAQLVRKVPFLAKKVTIWADFLVMRLIEIFNSIPGLLLILSILPVFSKPNIIHVMVVIGCISWTGIARFIRGELLRIRSLEYIEAAKALGYGELRIMLRHAIPNALTPVLITIAFGMASAVLLEAFISFIGIGLPENNITWGKLLSMARDKPSFWWLAIFPGMAIFITVLIFNLIGEGLTDALNPRSRK